MYLFYKDQLFVLLYTSEFIINKNLPVLSLFKRTESIEPTFCIKEEFSTLSPSAF